MFSGQIVFSTSETQDTQGIPQLKPDKFIFIFNRSTVVLLLENGAYPENVCILYCQIKLAVFLTFYVFGSCFRMLALCSSHPYFRFFFLSS